MTNIAIIGAGAAGLFCAINLKRQKTASKITIYESGTKPLAKVAITGGGRCNLTNSFMGIKSLAAAYPRGEKLIKRLFKTFDYQDTYTWFESNGIRLITQDDQCVFPKSQDAMEIVHMLLREATKLGIVIKTEQRVESIQPQTVNDIHRYTIGFAHTDKTITADCVVVTTGGSPKASGLNFLAPLNLEMIEPVASLFSFNIPNSDITQLMGTVIETATASIPGTKFKAQGPLLITHWGMSGPAILKLSSHAARHLAECNYTTNVSINWLGNANDQKAADLVRQAIDNNPQKQLSSLYIEHIPNRLWLHLLKRSELEPQKRCAETSKKGINKLVNTLINATYPIRGKSQFKDEFVTCGGIALSNIQSNTLECKNHPNLYFAGEVLDVDAITGGFNLQAAWTMGYIVAQSIAQKSEPDSL